jgi:hypothetical protein
MPLEKKKARKKSPTINALLKRLDKEVAEKGKYNIKRDGMFRCVLRAAFVKAFEFARYTNSIRMERANQSSFFMASALRGICEDLIALKFLRQLSRNDRDEVITLEMSMALYKRITEQTKFFSKERPFQLVLSGGEAPAHVASLQARLYAIGQRSGLWSTERKLLPIEQMAIKLKMRAVYDYFYRLTSDVVHFNPGIALRSGWGKPAQPPTKGSFSTKNFTRYYLAFCQIYGTWLFVKIARAFAADLTLTKHFRDGLSRIEEELNEIVRWPEAVTYEEMNREPPNMIVSALMRVMWDTPDGRKKLRASARDSLKKQMQTGPAAPAGPAGS